MQPSLLREVDLNKPVPRRYDLGMDFVESETFEKQKQNLPLSLKRTRARTAGAATEAAPTKRRCLAAISNNADWFDFSKDGSYCVMSVPLVPKNNWCFRNVPSWSSRKNCSGENRASFYRSTSYV